MKIVLAALFMLAAAAPTFAQDEAALGAKCRRQARAFYQRNAGPSDIRRTFEFVKMLKAGDELESFMGVRFGSFGKDLLLYTATGSYYSGWFIDAVLVDPVTCEAEKLVNIYSE